MATSPTTTATTTTTWDFQHYNQPCLTSGCRVLLLLVHLSLLFSGGIPQAIPHLLVNPITS